MASTERLWKTHTMIETTLKGRKRQARQGTLANGITGQKESTSAAISHLLLLLLCDGFLGGKSRDEVDGISPFCFKNGANPFRKNCTGSKLREVPQSSPHSNEWKPRAERILKTQGGSGIHIPLVLWFFGPLAPEEPKSGVTNKIFPKKHTNRIYPPVS